MTSRTRHQITLSFGAALLLTACDGADAPGVLAVMDARVGDRGACPIWQCGFNSADMFGASLHELNLDGEANADGLQILGVLPPAELASAGDFQLGVEGDALFLAGPSGDKLEGSAIVGTRLVLGHEGVPGIHIEIAAHQPLDRWAPGAPAAHTYALVVRDLEDGSSYDVCGGGLSDPMAQFGMVLGGETYDRELKLVEPDRPRWFTIACQGSAAAKMAMFGYGPQTSDTTPAQRQATLKMITADYCGDGVSYTKTGVEVHWEDLAGNISVAGDAGGVEAVWGEAGALCLDATRIVGVEVACALPSCRDFDLEDGVWISYLPA